MKAATRAATPVATGQNVADSTRRVFDYRRLFQIFIRHEYYGRSAGIGLFQSVPTPRTSARMQTLGMLFRPEQDGFSVLYDGARTWSARSQAAQEAEPLSFETTCTSPHFLSVTAMDAATSPRATPFHISNRVRDGAPIEGDGGTQADPGMVVRLPADVQPAPASVPGMIQVSGASRAVPVATIEIVLGGADWQGRCPMPSPSGPHEKQSVSYDVLFAARRTFWRYHIVARAGSGLLDNLTIDPAAFLGPFPETLANGDQASRFLSKAPLALASRSGVRWSLQGRRRDRMTRDAMLVERLPVPAVDQLGLLTAGEREALGTTERVCSEIFVYV